MSEPFIAEIRMFPYTFFPENWADCNGQLLDINQNQTLYAVIGTTYGGNGTTNFALPNLQGRTPVHPGNGVLLGMAWGIEKVYVDEHTMPLHNHPIQAEMEAGTVNTPPGNLTAGSNGANMYGSATSNPVTMDMNSISSVGGGAYHTNIQPSMGMRFCIALNGLFPSRN